MSTEGMPGLKQNSLHERFESLLEHVREACLACYGERLVSLFVFGSVGRGVPGPDSDLDLLVIARDLPAGRPARVAEFRAVEKALANRLAGVRDAIGRSPELSPVFKTPEEAEQGSPLFLDMVEDGRSLHDRDDFMAKVLDRLRERLQVLGARRIRRGNAWFWDLKPDYRIGEIFEV